MRIDKMLSNLKYGSRNDIKLLAKSQRIKVNNHLINDVSQIINPNIDEVKVDDRLVFYKDNVYLMMNKPKGIICANSDPLYPTYLSLIDEPYNRFDLNVCGRLDVDTEGLLILTTDGEFLHKVISPKKDIDKTYFVTLKHPLTNYQILEKGVTIKDGGEKPYLTKPAKIFDVTTFTCRIAISEGKFHQVKRMFEMIENEVIELKREKIGLLELDPNLLPGEYKELSESELLLILNE